MIFLHFYKVNNLFLHQSYLEKLIPSQINLIKNAKNHFLLLNKFKNTSSGQLWTVCEQKDAGKDQFFATFLIKRIANLTIAR